MSHPNTAIALASLRQPVRKALHTASMLGARGIEIDGRSDLRPSELSETGIRQIRRILDDLNLRVAAVTFRTRRGYDDLEDLDERVAATKNVMRFARQLGAKVVVNQIGHIPDDLEDPTWQTLQEVLTDLGNHGQRVGATLAAKAGSAGGADLARLIAALPDGSLGVDLDPGNLIINGFSPAEAAQALGRHIIYVTARDGVRDLSVGRGLEVQLGRGSADFPRLMGILEEHHYRGWYTAVRTDSVDPLADLGAAIQFLGAVLRDG